ncbi:hypothetical protein [Embleya hyalina]|uniref:Tetratricopeptide repeat protein n=1 Tax=Embleya hyalina TaxID=516124 RepID=A0A401Z6P9_9ACTN|nr:hypothetical protein [Embleya hyalina]GCE02513.1 hypothetical protein EHYA_10290 [Embleya hyalina]
MFIPDDVQAEELGAEARQELRGLPKTLADEVARNLVMIGRTVDEDPELAYKYAKVALRLASRVAAVREAAGIAAYMAGAYAEALSELRAARRMTGSSEHWAVMADCERGLGRPERALQMAGADEVKELDKAAQIELRIVAAGARRDLDQLDAAVVTLQVPELNSASTNPWVARLRFAYADALAAVGREDEARDWFGRAAEADATGETGAAERVAELDGLDFTDALDPDAEDDDLDEDEVDVDIEDSAAEAVEFEGGAAEDEAEIDSDDDADSDERGDSVVGDVKD